METKPTGIVVLMLSGWQNYLARASWRTLEVLPESFSIGRMNKFTVLGGGVRLHQEYADPFIGKLRATVAADGESTQRYTTTFRMEVEGKLFVKKFVSEQWILSCNSFVD
jgi:hypothetical protein